MTGNMIFGGLYESPHSAIEQWFLKGIESEDDVEFHAVDKYGNSIQHLFSFRPDKGLSVSHTIDERLGIPYNDMGILITQVR